MDLVELPKHQKRLSLLKLFQGVYFVSTDPQNFIFLYRSVKIHEKMENEQFLQANDYDNNKKRLNLF